MLKFEFHHFWTGWGARGDGGRKEEEVSTPNGFFVVSQMHEHKHLYKEHVMILEIYILLNTYTLLKLEFNHFRGVGETAVLD